MTSGHYWELIAEKWGKTINKKFYERRTLGLIYNFDNPQSENRDMRANHKPTGNYMFKLNNGYTGAMCKICSKLTIETPEQRQWRHSGAFIVNFEQISHIVLVFLLLTFNK